MRIPSNNRRLRALLVVLVATVTWMGCSMRLQWPEHRISVQMNASGLAEGATFVTAAGHEVRPERLAVTIWSIELERCDAKPPGMPTAEFFDAVRDATSMSTAHAHAERAPNRIWRSRVVDLTHHGDKSVAMGEMTPSPGEYCRIRVLLQAADEDSLELSEVPDMVDVSAAAAGIWRPTGTMSWRAFDWASSRTVERTFLLEEPLVLGEERALQGHIEMQVEALDWFDSIDFEGDEDATISSFLGNVRRSVSLEEAP
ncbi:MAG: hypothetical protein ACQEVA_11520 [Myxococcota bacterium]